MLKDTTIYINAGGRGTRLNSVFPASEKTGITKALLSFSGTTLIDMHIRLFRDLGFQNIIIAAGDHYTVQDHLLKFGPLPNGIKIITQDIQYDTAGDLLKVVQDGQITTKYVLVENVDTILDIDIFRFIQHHIRSGLSSTIALTQRVGVPNEGAFIMDEWNRVVINNEGNNRQYIESPGTWNGSSTGTVLFNIDFLKQYQWTCNNSSLYRDLLPELVQSNQLSAYNNEKKYFIDVGTPNPYYKIKRREDMLFKALYDRFLSYSLNLEEKI